MSNEQRYYDALKRIARSYQTSDQIRRNAPKEGFDYEEMLEMVYDNLQHEAEQAIRGKRRPRDTAPRHGELPQPKSEEPK